MPSAAATRHDSLARPVVWDADAALHGPVVIHRHALAVPGDDVEALMRQVLAQARAHGAADAGEDGFHGGGGYTGLEHPVVVDVGCRSTVFNAQAQGAASLVPRLLERGVRRYRVAFVRESREEATRVLSAYQDLLAGRIGPAVHEQFGVTKGTMQVRNPTFTVQR